MRVLQLLGTKVIAAFAVVAGILLIGRTQPQVFPLLERTARFIVDPATMEEKLVVLGSGILLAGCGVLALVPRFKGRRGQRNVSFNAAHGNVVIQLESVEAALTKVLGKMPEVRKVVAVVLPADSPGKVHIAADVVLVKDEASSARRLAERVSETIRQTAANMLGDDEIAKVDLNVVNVIVDTKKTSVAGALGTTAAAAAANNVVNGVDDLPGEGEPWEPPLEPQVVAAEEAPEVAAPDPADWSGDASGAKPDSNVVAGIEVDEPVDIGLAGDRTEDEPHFETAGTDIAAAPEPVESELELRPDDTEPGENVEKA